MVDTRVHVLYCNLNPPENFRLNYQATSFWCPNPINISADGNGRIEDKEVKCFQFPILPMSKYQEFLGNKDSQEKPTIIIKLFYAPISDENLDSIDIGIATLRLRSDLIYQNRPVWKWLTITNEWNGQSCGKLFVQLSARIAPAPLTSPLSEQVSIANPTRKSTRVEPELTENNQTDTDDGETDSCTSGYSGNDDLTLATLMSHLQESSEIENKTHDLHNFLSSPLLRENLPGSETRFRPHSLVKPIPASPYPHPNQIMGKRRSLDSSSTTTDLTVKILKSAQTRSGDKSTRPKKTVSFRINYTSHCLSNSRFGFRASTQNLNEPHFHTERKTKMSKIPVPIASSNRKQARLNSSMPI